MPLYARDLEPLLLTLTKNHSPTGPAPGGQGQVRGSVDVCPAGPRSVRTPSVRLTVSHCRTLPKGYMEKIVENIRSYNIHALLVIGGFEVRPRGAREQHPLPRLPWRPRVPVGQWRWCWEGFAL